MSIPAKAEAARTFGCSRIDVMLSRSAEGLFWMSRYLERAGHVCRLLASQFEAFEDSQTDEIDTNWRRIYLALGRTPFGGGFINDDKSDDFMLTDSFTLADDWTFENTNPDSLRSCISAARENARQVRNVIGKDLWECLNTAYLEIADVSGIESIWNNHPREFYRKTSDRLRTIAGINDGNCYRDHSWHFMQLGLFVERAQLISSFVMAQLNLFETANQNAESYWRSLLANCEARSAFQRCHSFNYSPNRVVDFLVCDPLLPFSTRYSLSRIAASLDEVSHDSRQPIAELANSRTKALIDRIDRDWQHKNDGDQATLEALTDIYESCLALHNDIGAAYFHYDIPSALPS